MDASYADPRGVMNLRPMRDDHSGMWLDVDLAYLDQMELKGTYLRGHTTLRSSVFGVHPPLARHARRASWEVLDLVVSRLELDYPGLVHRSDGVLTNVVTGRYWRLSSSSDGDGPRHDESDDDVNDDEFEHPLCIAAQLVQEDIAIMLPLSDGTGGAGEGGDGDGDDYVLGAAAICFADRWRVPDKIGKDLCGIHSPVERYPNISRSTSAFFRNLRVGNEKVRYTHTLGERPDLHVETDPISRDCPLPITGLPHSIYVRSERQCLMRLPISGGVLFTIRTYRMGLDDVSSERGRSGLLASLEMSSHATPLSNDQKETYGERVRSRFFGDA